MLRRVCRYDLFVQNVRVRKGVRKRALLSFNVALKRNMWEVCKGAEIQLLLQAAMYNMHNYVAS